MKVGKNLYQKSMKSYEPGQVIFSEGEPGDEMFIIIEGEVEIRKRTSMSTAKTLTIFKPGDIFGEMAIIENKPRSASAVATKASRMLAFNEAMFMAMIERNPDFAKKMILVLSERLRKSDSIIQNLTSTNRQNQILAGLRQYAGEKGLPTFKGHRVKVTEFLEWAKSHLGIEAKETAATIQDFQRRGVVGRSALGKEEILVDLTKQRVI
jgi:CRP/FNR family cyclic AMP-dependent transcriptional regulator